MDNSWWIILNAIGGHSWCRGNGSIDVLSWVQSGLGVNLINAFWVISDIFWGSDFYFYHLLRTFFHCDDYRLSCWCWLSSCELTLVSLVLHSLRQIIIGLRFSKTTWLQTYITFSKLLYQLKHVVFWSPNADSSYLFLQGLRTHGGKCDGIYWEP